MSTTNEEIDLSVALQNTTTVSSSNSPEQMNDNQSLGPSCITVTKVLLQSDIESLNIFEFTITHPQSDNKPVINNIKWDCLPDISNTDTATIVAKYIFKPKVYWINKSFLYDSLKVFASKTGFTPKCIDATSFGCNHCGKERIRSVSGQARNISSGPLQVDCKWSFRFASVIKTYKKSTITKMKTGCRNAFTENDLVYITTTDPSYKHTLPCKPSLVQVLYTNRTSGKYVSNISEMATFTLIGLLKSQPTLQSCIIRSILKQNFPSKEYVTNTDIYNSKIRCYRLMPIYERSNSDYQLFMENIKQSKNLQGIDYEAKTNDLAIQHSEDVWKSILAESSLFELEDNTWSLHAYMEKMTIQCPGFTYRLAHDSDGVCNGVLWMTASMRENFRRFGSYICLDAMKRGINSFLWHYFGVVMVNDVNANCLAAEGMIVAEREDAYNFIIQSTISMGMGVRTHEQIYCVAGDGIFNQTSLYRWNLPTATYITDQWHLYTHTLPKRFGNSIFENISRELWGMALSPTKDGFIKHYEDAKKILKNNHSRSIIAEVTLDDFAGQKRCYAKHMLDNTQGSIGRVGLSSSESNHSSVLCFLNDGVQGENKYCADPHILIQDLIARLDEHIKKYDRLLSNATNKLGIINHKLKGKNEIDNNHATNILIEASNFSISLKAYDMFKKEVDQSFFYTVSYGSHSTIIVSRIDSDAPPRIFKSIDEKCTCREFVSFMIQCRHKVCMKQCFDIQDFDIRHHFRDSSAVFISDETEGISGSFCLDTEDSSQTVIDNTVHSNNEYIPETNEIDTVFPYNNSNKTKNNVIHNSIQTSVDIREMMQLHSEIDGKFGTCSKEIQTFVAATTIKLKDLVTQGSEGNNIFADVEEEEDMKQLYCGIVQNYKHSFVGANNSFLGASDRQSVPRANKCSHSMLRKQPKRRLMSNKETSVRASRRLKVTKLSNGNSGIITNNKLMPMRKRSETIRKCSFCKQTSHTISNCLKRITLSQICKGREYKDYNAKMMFIESMKRGPRTKLNIIQKAAPVLKELFHKIKPNHILVHTSYAKEQTTLSQSIWSLGSLYFSVSLIGENGVVDSSYEKCLVEGSELEQYISKTIHMNGKYIYDDVSLTIWNDNHDLTHYPRGLSQDPPGENYSRQIM